MLAIREAEIGGAVVRRGFTFGDDRLLAGHRLSREAILAAVNLRQLIEHEYVRVVPRTDGDGERHIVRVGRDQFDVIEGRKLNNAPLSKEAAEELATRPA